MDIGILTCLLLNIFVKIQCIQLPRALTQNSVDPGEPLFLTQYIESGKIDEGRNLAAVPFTEKLNIKSFAGYFTVDKKYNSNQFVWYFPPMKSDSSAPVIVWLQGGPGCTSLYGIFNEHGPITLNNGNLELREITWALNHHVIYIDNPVGTGYSFTNDTKGYSSNQVQIGEQLYSTLTQFFQMFPELEKNKLIIAGESYGGKYAPALAYTIHKRNPDADVKLNLRGIALGNGFSDPENQLQYGDYLHQIGLVNFVQKNTIQEHESELVELIRQKDWEKAFDEFNYIMGVFERSNTSLFYNFTGFAANYDYLVTDNSKDAEKFISFVQTNSLRRDIHVGTLEFHQSGQRDQVHKHLLRDVMQSVAPWIEELLNHYYIVVYNGQLDLLVPYPLTVNYLRKLKFEGSDTYDKQTRFKWFVDGELAGYVTYVGRLMEVMVRNAGHMVPHDQPRWAHDMITTFSHNCAQTYSPTESAWDIVHHAGPVRIGGLHMSVQDMQVSSRCFPLV